MIHSIPNLDRVATLWAPGSRRFDWLGQVAASVRRGLRRLLEFGHRTPELRMSREWLEDYQRRSRNQA